MWQRFLAKNPLTVTCHLNFHVQLSILMCLQLTGGKFIRLILLGEADTFFDMQNFLKLH